jgi:hypothetical protein
MLARAVSRPVCYVHLVRCPLSVVSRPTVPKARFDQLATSF